MSQLERTETIIQTMHKLLAYGKKEKDEFVPAASSCFN